MLKISLKVLMLLIILTFCSFPAMASNTTAISTNNIIDSGGFNKAFTQANKLYDQKDYINAILLYQHIINKGIQNGNIYYNLANAYFKNEQIGKAIVNYEKALVFMPRNADLRANLKFTLEQTTDQISAEDSCEPVLSLLIFWYYGLNLFELIILTTIVNYLLCACILLGLFYKHEILKVVNFIGIIILVILVISTSVKLFNNYKITKGVVIVPETEIKSGDSTSYSVLFKLHEGTEFQILQQNDNWFKIALPDERKGWINKDSVELVDARF